MSRLGRVALALGLIAAGVVAAWRLTRRAAGRAPVRAGGRFRIVQCSIHGIAYDAELETCPDCATARDAAPGHPLEPSRG